MAITIQDTFERANEFPLGNRATNDPFHDWEPCWTAAGGGGQTRDIRPKLEANVVWTNVFQHHFSIFNRLEFAQDTTVQLTFVGTSGNVATAHRVSRSYRTAYTFQISRAFPDFLSFIQWSGGGATELPQGAPVRYNLTAGASGTIKSRCIQIGGSTIRLIGYWNGSQVMSIDVTSTLYGGQPGFTILGLNTTRTDPTQPNINDWQVVGTPLGEPVATQYLDP